MSKKITDLEGRLDAAFKRSDKAKSKALEAKKDPNEAAREWGARYRKGKAEAKHTSQGRAAFEKKYGRVNDWDNPKH